MKPGRLPAPAGSLIDRDRPIDFSFEGRRYTGFAGDTIASALLANGVSMLSRSFKYHRPRGVLTACGQDANTLVQLGDEPNVLADRRRLEPGMAATAVNVLGSLEKDRGEWLGRLARFMPVGFYYKAFYKPKPAWRFWEPMIRRLAGLGTVNPETHHAYYDKQYLFCDVAVVGGGPAGMAAALEAAKAGAEVLLIEENATLGGALNYARFDPEAKRARRLRAEFARKIADEANIRVLTDATCNGWFSDNWLPIIKGRRMYKLRAAAVVIAAGAYEQPMVFRNNDLPGVMLGSAAQRLIHLYGVRPGERAVVATANGDGYGVALDLAEAGVEVACVVDLRSEPPACPRHDEAVGRGVPVVRGATVREAIPTAGNRGVAGARIARITGEGACAETADRFACDLVLMSVGYHPTANLIHHARGRMTYDEAQAAFVIAELPPHLFAAGSVNGVHDLDAAIADGRRAGWEAAKDTGFAVGRRPVAKTVPAGSGPNYPWPIFPHADGKDFVDFDEDLQVKDILNGIAEGYDNIELLKRFSTVGMGPSQGRLSSLPSVRLAAKAIGKTIDETGTTTSRPPFTVETFGHLAGRGFEPVRHSAMHRRHLERGAEMMPAGLWLRPAVYGPKEARAETIRAEATAVRENVGLIDVSTLGGIEVRGPDAAEFLNRIYTFAYLKQPVGRARYVLMIDMSGVIVDDGVACRLRDNHFYVTATTGGAQAVYQQMMFYNAQWQLDVDITNVTAAYAGVNIAGPKSRDVLARITDIDLSAEAFPYMGVREGAVAGIPARLLRVGFVGELGYEVHVPASQGEALWDALIETGASEDIRPFGVEAQRLLRLEKGHIIIGQDTDGLTHPYEADMAWAIARKKPYFVGMRSVKIQQANGLERKLVGFSAGGADAPVPRECHLVIRDGEITGRVTSCAYSPAVGKVIGLAYVAPDQAGIGGRFEIKLEDGRMIGADVVPLPFYDPDGKRQEM
ncbi:MAG: 2Fe-2S iron-sulfur cluster-binding protein [Alphaproteobacteria bacterium]